MYSPRSPGDRGDGPLSPCSPPYYSVYLASPEPPSDFSRYVHLDKQEALKMAKKNKSARFKCFYSIEEAKHFAINGPAVASAPCTLSVSEKSSPFKAPISQELVQFRKCIERGNLSEVESSVFKNPRYLVSSGDTPSILQEGCRYNALHVAAKFNNPSVCEFILHCITSLEFMKRLYGEDEIKDTLKQRCDILLDLYLNTPDKAANETPLHYASKIGALDVIKILVSYDKCDKSRTNKHGQTALDVLATRRNDITADEREEIKRLLSSDYYIAVFRPLDPIRPPVLEGPFLMPSLSSNNFQSHLDSEMRISGVAGPMKYEEALNFKKLWKRPRGSPLSSPGSPLKSPTLAFSPSSFKRPDKIIERIGRDLCLELGIHWAEYWPFLDDFANFQKEKGINLLESFFQKKFNVLGPSSSNLDDSLNHLFNKLTLEDKAGKKVKLNKDFEQSDHYPPVNFNSNLSYTYINKTCQIYANKLYESLLMQNKLSFVNSLNKCQQLVNSCVNDKRYISVEFNRIHSKLACLVSNSLKKNNGDCVASSIMFLNSIIETEELGQTPFLLCMCLKLVEALDNNFECDERNNAEISIKTEWLSLSICNCLSEMKQKSIKKKLNFKSRSLNNSLEISNSIIEDNEINMEAGYDSDSCYMTPPTSPRLLYRNAANDSLESDREDFSSDDEMYSADEGVPITIEGEQLSDIDKTVYDAIDPAKVIPSKHPYTYQWMQSCKRKFTNIFTTSLILSPLSPAYLKKCEDIKLSLREHLLNNSPLSPQ